MPTGELLVLLAEAEAGEALERLREAFHVVHVAPPRLAIVQAETDDAPEARLRSIPGVVNVAVPDAGGLPDAQAFSAEEQLFVDAWVLRWRESAGKQRPGDGLPWDAEGFQPA